MFEVDSIRESLLLTDIQSLFSLLASLVRHPVTSIKENVNNDPGCGFPVVAKKIKWMKIPPRLFFACKHFGTGVLIATAFVHVSPTLTVPWQRDLPLQLVPTAFALLTDPCLPDVLVEGYPAMPGVIMMFSLFCLFVLEMYLKAKVGGHSHGGATGEEISHPRPQHVHQVSAPIHLTRNDTAASLPPYDPSARGHQYSNSYEEKLMAK